MKQQRQIPVSALIQIPDIQYPTLTKDELIARLLPYSETMETKRFVYSMQGADDAGGWVPIEGMTDAYHPAIKLPHPQTHMRELGFNHIRSECFTIPCIWLFECTSWPETLPPHIREKPAAKFTEEWTA